MIHEGYRSIGRVNFSLDRGGGSSGQRPGEKIINFPKSPEPEPQRSLLQEMQFYITTRQSLREQGYFVEREREPADISFADATHNDLEAIAHVSPFPDNLPDNTRDIMTKGNNTQMRNVFDAYAMEQFSPEKKREVLKHWEGVHAGVRKDPDPIRVTQLTPAETETVTWLLARIGVPFDAPPEGFKERDSSLLFRMRTAAAKQQPEWEQKPAPEPEDPGNILLFTRRR